MDELMRKAIVFGTSGPKTWTDSEVEAACMYVLELALRQKGDAEVRALVQKLIQRMRAAIDSLAAEAGGRQ